MATGDVEDWRQGAAKVSLISRLLDERKRRPDLFASGDYQPLELEGARAGEALAFAREHDGAQLLVVCATRASQACVEAADAAPGAAWWGDTRVAGRSVAEITGGRAVGWRLAG